ncbi:MAG TPA: M14 family metallopeptidase [Candidatus Thermoplasmatota archaeon]|nr:M14 family metallopeptidase [Candidatus Thermoplasmatota archaeon]
MRTALLVLPLLLAGCVGGLLAPATLPAPPDPPVALPLADGFFNRTGDPCYKVPQQTCAYTPFHTLEELHARILSYPDLYPGFAEVRVIGASREGRPIHDVVVTDRSVPGPKLTTLIDGGHHANELEGIEAPLYVIDFLLENRANATVASWLAKYEMHFVPVLNPDGYVRGTRGNALGVNLNRNYDVDWGDPVGASNPVMGQVGNVTGRPVPSQAIVAENCGAYPFSEPETVALRDLMAELAASEGGLAFYYTHHTPTNGFIAPWSAGRAPFPIPPEHQAVLEAELAWVRAHTEYKAGKAQWGNFSAGLPYAASGTSMDWAYATHRVPTFTIEIAIYYTSVFSDGYVDRYYLQPYKGLDYWLRATLPIELHLLANAERLARWEVPDVEPPLPDGAPPELPAPGTPLWFPEGDHEAWRPRVPAVA